MACTERLAQALRRLGYRVTPQRAVILEIIAHRGGHQSAQEVYAEAIRRLPGLNLVTVYRTLETLHQAGMVDVFSVGTGVDRFALREEGNPHGHLVCRACGRVLEFPIEELQRMTVQLRNDHGFVVEPSHLTLRGVCKECATSLGRIHGR